MRETILHAAVKTTNGFICIGKCHADCFFQGRMMGMKMSKRSAAQGFMTSRGRFVRREEAARIAKRRNQVVKDGKRRRIVSLISEDIWYREDIIYCPMRGYCKISYGDSK
jgi:hypothetical protein